MNRLLFGGIGLIRLKLKAPMIQLVNICKLCHAKTIFLNFESF